jgi:hypothetical protein
MHAELGKVLSTAAISVHQVAGLAFTDPEYWDSQTGQILVHVALQRFRILLHQLPEGEGTGRD